MERTASAVWEGRLEDGRGTMETSSGILEDSPYSFGTRFEEETGTNPEELIGAAHAGCFSMALSMILGEAGFEPRRINTRATVTLEEVDDGFAITKVHLETRAEVPDASGEDFAEAAHAAKEGCPVSKLLDCEITMDATLVN